MSFVTTYLGLPTPPSGNSQLEDITTLHGVTRQYYHAVSARRRIRECMLLLPSCYFYVTRSCYVTCA
jgi:hypothetical protein